MNFLDTLLGRKTRLIRIYRDGDIVFTVAGGKATVTDALAWLHQAPLFEEEAGVRYIDQLAQESLAAAIDAEVFLAWADYYDLEENPEHAPNLPLLGLPDPWHWHPALQARRAVSDPDFQVSVTWAMPGGAKLKGNPQRTGGVITWQEHHYRLPALVWRLLEALEAFAAQPNTERTQDQTEVQWGDLRALAIHARAQLDQYLERTVVLTPEQLELRLRKVSVGDMDVVEVVPGIPGVPEGAASK